MSEVEKRDGDVEGREDRDWKDKRVNVHTRREFLKLSAAMGAAVALGSSFLWGCGEEGATTTSATSGSTASTAAAATTTTPGVSGIVIPRDQSWCSLFASLDNQYFAWWSKGAEDCAKKLDLKFEYLTNDNKQEVEVSQMENKIQAGVSMFFVNTPGPGPIPAMAKLASTNKVWLANVWDNPDWWLPIDSGEYYVGYFLPFQIDPAYNLGKRLIKEMGGKGNIINIAGTPGGTADWTRSIGLDKAIAEYPDVKLLDRQPSSWSRIESRQIMDDLVVKYGDLINGVFGQNDDVGIGAMNALEAAGIKGVPVTGIDGNGETIDLIKEGRFTATVSSFPFWDAGHAGLRVMDAFMGWRPSPVETQQFTGTMIVDNTNAQQYQDKFFNAPDLPFDWELMLHSAHPDDWDMQNEVACMDPEEHWAPVEKPPGWVLNPEYAAAKAAGDIEKYNELYAAHYKKKITEGIPEVVI